MRWTLLLLLLTAPCRSRAGPLQEERVPFVRLTSQSSWGSGGSNATVSPCEGLPAAGATAWTVANRSLERLPRCLPRSLRSLDGSHNLLRALSAAELGHLPELQELTVRHNRIATLRWGPGGPSGLRALDLSYNQLDTLQQCTGPALRSLRLLELAGNPLRALPPRAFVCFPALQRLNLSYTELGRGAQGNIARGAFAGEVMLKVLDLSGTHLQQIESGWMRDLPNLTHLYLRKMPRLRTLEGDIFKMTPKLRQLNCQDSPALTSVHTHIFQDTPSLQVLLLHNCNLSSFPPWTRNSSQVLSVNLFGNPLTCNCELSWLLLDAKRTVLRRVADTMCTPAAGPAGPFSAALPLSQLPDVCRSGHSTTLPDSNPSSFAGLASAPPSPGLSAQPARGQPSVTKASPSTALSLTQASWTPHGTLGGTVPSSAHPTTASLRPTSTAPRTASGTGHQEHAASLVPKPRVSAATTSLATKHLSPIPTAGSTMSRTQPDQRTQPAPQAPHSSPSDDEIPVILLDDSEEGTEEEGSKVVRASHHSIPCDYDPCRHLQTPCVELQRRSRCTCPGLTREDTVPDLPQLQGVSEVTDTSLLVHWCAPYSVVRTYQIHYSVEGEAGNQSVVGDIYATARQHPLYRLSPGTTYRVCVVAANAAGLSQPRSRGWKRPCTTITTKPSLVAVLVVLGTACGLLLISTLVLFVCLCRRGRKLCGHNHDQYLVAFRNPYLLPFENPGQDCRQSKVTGLCPEAHQAPGSTPSTTHTPEASVKLQTFT
ncbi:PREDICTED: leucine-rich repeat neuronal protein 4 [Chinchilla lanigera]|uniref:Leucine rich repeat neuronal 4 n=1 Tax=Chinchilla lanigera TaxID=34839 RepID=A0A8C2W2I4_CHILA|nr:PREDICTED: leucine-rich repeat neuronal protein 4 [Chinchilla lanigera]XP_005380911.1 PREDICTED: leucine-rich repeat neuronal protein 4 [Chinchilla lanigera]